MKLHKPRTYYRIMKAGLLGQHVLLEPKVMKTMRQVQGRLFVDIGANVGIYSIGLRNHFWNVFAYEPNPAFFNQLKQKSVGTNIIVYPYAISDKDGKTTLFLDDSPNRCNGSADTILSVFDYAPASNPSMAKKTYQGSKGVMVETRSLDSLLAKTQVDLVKIDVEGAEFLVLEGARHMFESHRIARAMVELHNRYMKSPLESFFAANNYTGVWVDLDHYYATRNS